MNRSSWARIAGARRRAVAAVVASALLGAACGAGAPGEALPPEDPPYVPPPESCVAPSVDEPTRFAPCSTGSGVFGTWTLDDLGLPAYDYGLDQNADERASYPRTDGVETRAHWAAFGNDRVNGLVSNDGFVELVTQDRGVSYLAKVGVSERALGGGFGWVDDGERVWCTAYKLRPRGSVTRRRFGMGYAEAETSHRDVRVLRRTFAPAGDAPVLLDEVVIENLSSARKTVAHYEYWDVARRPIEINWLVSGQLPQAVERAAMERDARNELFTERATWSPEERLLAVRRRWIGPPRPPRGEPDEVDRYPGDPFLAQVIGETARVFTDEETFFGAGGPEAPDAVVGRRDSEVSTIERSAVGQPLAFVMRSDLELAPGEKRTLRFAYGYTAEGEAIAIDPAWRDPARDLRREQADALRSKLLYFATEREPFLHRELAWHASQVEVSTGYREYWDSHVVPQGSAYLYLHGADGALRDTALFAMPLVYTHPERAREQLRLAMGLAHAEDSRFSYAFQGHGRLDDGLGIHSSPSDLDLFFLLAMIEYLGATGDVAFLDERVSYWPRRAENEATVLAHVTRAVRHLFDAVGTGEHGLVRLHSGDWSDGIVFRAPDRALAKAKGESVPNTQMALHVLPLVADLVEPGAPELADEIRGRLPALASAARAAVVSGYFGRAYFGDGKLVGADAIDLEAQVWGLVAPILSPGERAALSTRVRDELDLPSPIGAPLTRGAEVWPAISHLLTWGYTRDDDERAFAHFARNSLAARARAFPEAWHGIWSGPDGVSSTTGRTWASPVTPMTDFPTMNNNVHAMPLLAAARLAGIEPVADGVRVEPHVPDARYAFVTRLFEIGRDGGVVRGRWRPAPGVTRRLVLRPPRGEAIAAVTVDGADVPVTAPDEVSVSVVAKGPDGLGFEMRLR
ncbi:MAG: hypothetical protein KF795_11425 [Labilithrix sp.]|nr:hypothetical protein [Labilithrix sp.]